jgi:hypothetical protein
VRVYASLGVPTVPGAEPNLKAWMALAPWKSMASESGTAASVTLNESEPTSGEGQPRTSLPRARPALLSEATPRGPHTRRSVTTYWGATARTAQVEESA